MICLNYKLWGEIGSVSLLWAWNKVLLFFHKNVLIRSLHPPYIGAGFSCLLVHLGVDARAKLKEVYVRYQWKYKLMTTSPDRYGQKNGHGLTWTISRTQNLYMGNSNSYWRNGIVYKTERFIHKSIHRHVYYYNHYFICVAY